MTFKWTPSVKSSTMQGLNYVSKKDVWQSCKFTSSRQNPPWRLAIAESFAEEKWGFFLYLLRQYFCRGDSVIYIFFVFFKIFIDFVEIMRHLAYSLSNLTLIILSIKIKTLTRNEKEKVICCSFVDFIALYSHATISLRHLLRICVVVWVNLWSNGSFQ